MNRNKKFTLAVLAVGLAPVVSAVNAIINAYFGIQYFLRYCQRNMQSAYYC